MCLPLLLLLGQLLVSHGGTASPLPPFTEAEILTKPAVDSSNDTMPVELNIALNADFFKGGGTVNPFAEAELRLAFNVPNPGYDMMIMFDTNTYPRLRDQYGHEWMATKKIAFSFLKEQTKITYNTGGVPVVTRHSVSEEATVLEGNVKDDSLCTAGTLACCPSSDGRRYTRYALVQSPVPPYQCTTTSVFYKNPSLSYNYHATVTIGEEDAATKCSIMTEVGNCSRHCTEENVQVSVNVFPDFGFPSVTNSLCRSGNSLTDTTYSSQPIFVQFCEDSRCVGYTPENYRLDRGRCGNVPLGAYTAVDGNNTNQFWYYETHFSFENTIPRCIWMNDVVMGSGNRLEQLSVRCNMFPSSNWSVTHRFPKVRPVLYYITPLFLYSRTNRIEARREGNGSVTVVVEFVPLSPANGTWTLNACYESTTICRRVDYLVDGSKRWYPMHIYALLPPNPTVSDDGIHAYTMTVMVSVKCKDTPLASPFRFLVRDTRVTVEPPQAVGPKKHINLDLARQPYEEIPAPPGTNGVMLRCVDDFTFSVSTGGCVPFTDEECKQRYEGRRNRFDAQQRACVVTLPRRTEPIRAVPIPLREAPKRTFDPAEQRRRLEEIQLPPWMKPMKELLREADEARQSTKPTVKVQPEREVCEKPAPRIVVFIFNLFFLLATIFLLILMWKHESVLNGGAKFWLRYALRNRRTVQVVSPRLSTYMSSSGPTAASREVMGAGAGTGVRYRVQEQQHEQMRRMMEQRKQRELMVQQQFAAQLQLQQQQLLLQQQQLQTQISRGVYGHFYPVVAPMITARVEPQPVTARDPNEPYRTEENRGP